MLFCHPASGLKKVSHSHICSLALFWNVFRLSVWILSLMSVNSWMCRQAMDLICESSARQQNRRRSPQRDARPKAYGAPSQRERHLPSQRRTLLAVFRWNYPPSVSQSTRERSHSLAHQRRNHDDNCRLPDTLPKVSPPTIRFTSQSLTEIAFPFSSMTFAMRK